MLIEPFGGLPNPRSYPVDIGLKQFGVSLSDDECLTSRKNRHMRRQDPKFGSDMLDHGSYISWGSLGLFLFRAQNIPHQEVFYRSSKDYMEIFIALDPQFENYFEGKRTQESILGCSSSLMYLRKNEFFRGVNRRPGRTISISFPPEFIFAILEQEKFSEGYNRIVNAIDKSDLIKFQKNATEIHQAGREIFKASESNAPFSELFFFQKVTQIIYMSLDSLYGSGSATDVIHEELARNLKEILDQDFRRSFNIADLSRICGTNRTTLQNAFKARYGLTISEYRHNLRMAKAQEFLLGGQLSVAAVAYEVGYNDAPTFTSAYKAYFGHAPNQAKQLASRR